MAAENWGWYFELTPAFVGSGMLVGLNVAISFFGGTVLAWGIIGPALVHDGAAFGKLLAPDDPKWGTVASFVSLGPKFVTKDHPSPRYWLLWPGVLAMITVSMVELACQWRVFWFASKAIGRGTMKVSSDLMARAGRPNNYLAQKGMQREEDLVKDSASKSTSPHTNLGSMQRLILLLQRIKLSFGCGCPEWLPS